MKNATIPTGESWRSFAVLPKNMPSPHKKVIVRKLDRDTVNGYVAPANFVVEGKLEMLNTAGNVVAIDLREIKIVYFVRDFTEASRQIPIVAAALADEAALVDSAAAALGGQ